jgi:drug/metabolite transporter (DMT)-like permease
VSQILETQPKAEPLVDNLKGALWLLGACLLFTVMSTLAKLLGDRLHAFEIAFARSFFGFLLVLPLILRGGLGAWRTRRLDLHVTRSAMGSLGLLCGFFAVTNLPLADATALSFTKPLFQVLLAALVLGELVRARRWIATGVGFLGVVVMLRPGLGSFEAAAVAGLAGSMFGAMVSVTLRRLTQQEREITILAYLGVVGSIITGLPAAFVWITPTGPELLLMLLMSAIGMISQVCMMRGFRLGEASAMAPLDYLRLPLAALFGVLFFAEQPDIYSFLGALIIAGSTLYIAQREARIARERRLRPTANGP